MSTSGRTLTSEHEPKGNHRRHTPAEEVSEIHQSYMHLAMREQHKTIYVHG